MLTEITKEKFTVSPNFKKCRYHFEILLDNPFYFKCKKRKAYFFLHSTK